MTADQCLDDAERQHRKRGANLARRVAMLRFHGAHRDYEGKSTVAQRGGYARMAKDPGGPRAAATDMALARWHHRRGSEEGK